MSPSPQTCRAQKSPSLAWGSLRGVEMKMLLLAYFKVLINGLP